MRLAVSSLVTIVAVSAMDAGVFTGPLLQRGAPAVRNPAYVSQFPPVDRVRAEITGADPMDTAARQMGAFWQLQGILKELSGFRFVRNQLTPDERRLIGEYSAAYQAVSQPYASYPDKAKWYQMHARYETDDGFRNELFTRFLSPALLTQYQQTKRDTRATVQANRPSAAPPRPPDAPATAVVAATSELSAPTGTANALGEKPLILMKESFAGFLQQRGIESADFSETTYAFLTLGTLFLLILAFYIPISIAYHRQPEEARIEGLGKFARMYLRARSGSLIIAFLALLVGGLVWAIIVYFAVRALLRFGRGDRDAQRSRWTKARARAEKEWIESIGATTEERITNINRMFDRKEKTLTVVGWAEWGAAGALLGTVGLDTGYVGFRISRNLATLAHRQIEFLRALELLAACGAEPEWCRWRRFALIWGEGEAVIEDHAYKGAHRNEEPSVTVASQNIVHYMTLKGISVTAAENEILNALETRGAHKMPAPVLAALRQRLRGGGAWLSEEDLPGSIFAPGGPYSVRLGVLDETNQMLTYDLARLGGEGSLITIAPPGSGKTLSLVLPNMLTWPGSAVVLDVKGEIYRATSEWRRKNVGPVYKFSPMAPDTSHSYNPLDFVQSDPDYLWEDARFLADMMIVPNPYATNPEWQNTARDLVQAAIAYVCIGPDLTKRSVSRVVDIVHGVGWNEFVGYLQARVDMPPMRRAGVALSEMRGTVKDGVMFQVQQSMSHWSSTRVDRVTRKSDWSPLDLYTKPGTTIYICVNLNEIESLLSVLRVFIAHHVDKLISEPPPTGTPPVLFMLDEFPQLKNMPPLVKALRTGRGFGVRLWMFAQDIPKLKEAYPDAEALLTNCAVQTFMNVPLNSELAQKLSDILVRQSGAPLDADSKKLLDPMELAGPKFKELMLVIGSNTAPAKVRKSFVFNDPELRARMPLALH